MPGPKRSTDNRTQRDEMFSELFPRLDDAAYFADQIGCLLDADGNPPEMAKAWEKLAEMIRNVSDQARKLAK